MLELEIEGNKYTADKIPLVPQFHVLRRMGSLFPSLRSAMTLRDADPLMAASYIAAALSRLDTEDCDFVIFTCLATVKRQQNNLWASVSTGNSLMFQDVTLPAMMELVYKVLEYNYGSFMTALLSKVSGLTPAA